MYLYHANLYHDGDRMFETIDVLPPQIKEHLRILEFIQSRNPYINEPMMPVHAQIGLEVIDDIMCPNPFARK